MTQFLAGLDTVTLKVVATLVMLLTCASTLMLRLMLPEERYTREWAGGSGLVLLGLACGAIRELVPVSALIPLSNALVAMGGVMFSNGVASFCESPRRRWPVAPVGAAIFLAFCLFTYVYPSLSTRVTLISLLYAVLCLRMSRLLWVSAHPRMLCVQRLTAVLIGLETLYYALGIAGAFIPQAAREFMDAPLVYNGVYLNAIILFVGLIFALAGLTNRRLQLRLEHLAQHDMLTGVLNRRALEEAALRELARARRQGKPVSVIALDIDHFKLINDQHGHQTGDRALRLFVQVILPRLREEDLVGRIGGEEFCIVLPGASTDTARSVAERLRAEVEAARLTTANGELRMTTSAGTATFDRESHESWEALLHAADQGLYAAKRAGRNRVVVTEDLAEFGNTGAA